MRPSTSVQSRVPPGFRFHPTEEELLSYYLRKKVACDKIDLDVIREIDLNKLEPWEIQEKCKLGSAPQNDWYFFSHKDKKYPTGTRTNRATAAGFWKATGRDKAIYASSKRIGMRKTLVFYRGRAPHGQKSDWIMHEYRLLDDHQDGNFPSNVAGFIGEAPAQEDGWVVCRVFKKKNHLKPSAGSHDSSIGQDQSQMMDSRSNEDLDQVLQYIGTSWKHESDDFHDTINITDETNNHSNNFGYHCLNRSTYQRFIQVPASESPTSNLLPIDFPSDSVNVDGSQRSYPLENKDVVNGWAAVDRLVASHLNGESEASQEQLVTFDDPTSLGCPSNSIFVDSHGDAGLWSLTQLSSSTTDCSSRVLHGTV